MGSAESAQFVGALADVCRAKGIGRLRVGDVEIEMGAPPPAPPKVLTEEEKAASAKETRRAKYKRVLGRDVSDEELAGLP